MPIRSRLLEELQRRNVLKVAATYLLTVWLIIEVCSVVLPLFGTPDWVLRVLVVAAGLGLPVTLVLSWVFAMTPDGVIRTENLTQDPAAVASGSGLNYAIIGLLVLVVAVLLVTRFEPAPERPVAILPFDSLGPDDSQRHLAVGLSEDLLTLLSKIPDLRVAARSSAFRFDPGDMDLTTIAERLRVEHVLVGNVRMAGTHLRINTRLVRASTGFSVWSESYDRTIDGVFKVQDDIAAAVARALKSTLPTGLPKARSTSPEAYTLYLRARHLGAQHTATSMQTAVGQFQEALALDPDYVPAWENLAAVYMNQSGMKFRDRSEGFELARAAANRALAIDPDHGPSLGRLGWIRWFTTAT